MHEAAAPGAHILCEKPLTLNAPAARALLDAVERAGVRHAYAASYRYDPSVAWLRELVAAGQIGPLREIAYASRYRSWPHEPSCA